ncbi:sulfurtransferase TusA family protein [Vibrio sp. M260118]|uniref:sulfurtransferase TusA family protein n=1 Tax=Vibrio sp. M260118 TaxID=3020896 RepID=UPI002F3FB524
MESRILDLRQERCPMALLLAKRHVKGLSVDEHAIILVSESSSFADIAQYLRQNCYELVCEEKDGYHRMRVCRIIKPQELC